MQEEIVKEIAKEEYKPTIKVIRDWFRSKKYKKLIIRHENTYITLKEDDSNIMYCSRCWDREKELIQMDKRHGGKIMCPNCNQICSYDRGSDVDYNAVINKRNDSVTSRRR